MKRAEVFAAIALAAVIWLVWATRAPAGSAYPGYTVDQLEIFNPTPNNPYGGGLANVCLLVLYEAGDPSALIGKCILKFVNKRSIAPYLLGIPPVSQFHISHPTTGAPMWIVTDVRGEQHNTNDQMMLAAWVLRADPAIRAGQVILLTVDGPSPLIIDGR